MYKEKYINLINAWGEDEEAVDFIQSTVLAFPGLRGGGLRDGNQAALSLPPRKGRGVQGAVFRSGSGAEP